MCPFTIGSVGQSRSSTSFSPKKPQLAPRPNAPVAKQEILKLTGNKEAELKELRIIYMSRTEVSDLSPLADLDLERIFIRKTG
ncbi:hypothetical protein N9007_00425 [bacterium]|nr:hypothetical protein [bacterium]